MSRISVQRLKDARHPEAMQKMRRTIHREGTFRGPDRLTVAVGASILTICFFLPPSVPWVVVHRRRRVGKEAARFFPAHPVKRVGFIFIRFLPSLEAGRADFPNLEPFEIH